MRDYARILPEFWLGRTGKALRRIGPEAQVLAFYLMTSPTSNLIGLYPLSLGYVSSDTGLSVDVVRELLAKLARLNFAYYDLEDEIVYLPEMCRIQVADSLKPGDNRCKPVREELTRMRRSRFAPFFAQKYRDAMLLAGDETGPLPDGIDLLDIASGLARVPPPSEGGGTPLPKGGGAFSGAAPYEKTPSESSPERATDDPSKSPLEPLPKGYPLPPLTPSEAGSGSGSGSGSDREACVRSSEMNLTIEESSPEGSIPNDTTPPPRRSEGPAIRPQSSEVPPSVDEEVWGDVVGADDPARRLLLAATSKAIIAAYVARYDQVRPGAWSGTMGRSPVALSAAVLRVAEANGVTAQSVIESCMDGFFADKFAKKTKWRWALCLSQLLDHYEAPRGESEIVHEVPFGLDERPN